MQIEDMYQELAVMQECRIATDHAINILLDVQNDIKRVEDRLMDRIKIEIVTQPHGGDESPAGVTR